MNSRVRASYPTILQKRRLIQLVARHPDLTKKISAATDFNVRESQARLWQVIASEVNALPHPAAKKTWKQWRRTFQDLRSKYKRVSMNGNIPNTVMGLNDEERRLMGIKIEPSNNQQDTEFVNMEGDSTELFAEIEEETPEPESQPERKPFSQKKKIAQYKTKRTRNNSHNAAECTLNCNTLALQEEQKIKIKEDYYTFKKEYLQQKLKTMQEQVEALQSIARSLENK